MTVIFIFTTVRTSSPKICYFSCRQIWCPPFISYTQLLCYKSVCLQFWDWISHSAVKMELLEVRTNVQIICELAYILFTLWLRFMLGTQCSTKVLHFTISITKLCFCRRIHMKYSTTFRACFENLFKTQIMDRLKNISLKPLKSSFSYERVLLIVTL